MGCTSISNCQIKNPLIQGFFNYCNMHGFTESRMVKITKYSYEYIRGSKQWISKNEKNIFHPQYPILLSPCQPEQFDNLISSLQSFKVKYPMEFKNFPTTLGMLICTADPFPKFQTQILGKKESIIYETSNEPTIFVHWKLQEMVSISKLSYTLRNTENRFKDIHANYVESSYKRAKHNIRSGFKIVGVCFDDESKRSIYEQYIDSSETHIWIREQDQSYQVFRFAEDENNQVRGLENSVYIISNGLFVCSTQENFGDSNFVNQIFDLSSSITNTQDRRQNNFKNQVKMEIRRDDYKRSKTLIVDKLPNLNKKPIGDTFYISLSKLTYFYNYQKIGATYCTPILKCAGSRKYKENADNIVKYIRDQTAIAHMQCDFKNRETIDKVKFFKDLQNRLRQADVDVKLVLEKSMEISFTNQQIIQYTRSIDSIHNAPLSISAVYSKKEGLMNVAKQINQVECTYSHCELKLIKQFFANPYGLTTQFNIGSLYQPIPNVYSVIHNDQSGQIAQSIIRNVPKGIFESKLINSEENSMQFPIIEQIPSNVSRIEMSMDGDIKQEFEYDMQDCLQQLNNEVLVIYLLDYTQQQVQTLAQLLQYIKQQNWNKEQIRVIGLCLKQNDGSFEQILQKYRLEIYMSQGLFESWMPIEQNYLGINFQQLISDLYELNQQSPVLVIDQLHRLLYRGVADFQFAQIIKKIIQNQDIKNTIHPTDRSLKHRVNLAMYSREWKVMKEFRFSEIPLQQIQQYLALCPLQKGELWKFRMTSFQIWDSQGYLIKKFYEKPQIMYRFERPELSVKFHSLTQEIINRLGIKKIDIVDLQDQPGQKKDSQLGEQLVQ